MATTQRKIQAHNLTTEELQDIQYKQNQNEGLPMVKTKDGYKFPKAEKHLVHAEITSGGFNPITGEALGSPRVQTFYPREYQDAKNANTFAGQSVKILHDGGADVEDVEPTDFLTPQIVSTPGAGTPLTISADEILSANAATLKEYHKKFFPDMADNERPTTKKDLQAALEERRAFLATEAEAEQNAQLEQNRLGNLGGEGSEGTE